MGDALYDDGSALDVTLDGSIGSGPYYRFERRSGLGSTLIVFSCAFVVPDTFTGATTLRAAPEPVLFLNCPGAGFFQRGVPGLAGSLGAMAERLRSIPNRRYAGSSMGGYAALACGLTDPDSTFVACSAEHVLARPFSYFNLHCEEPADPEWSDLLSHPHASPDARGVVIYGAHDDTAPQFIDDERWRRFPGVRVYTADCDHSVHVHLAKAGVYLDLLRDPAAVAASLVSAGLLRATSPQA